MRQSLAELRASETVERREILAFKVMKSTAMRSCRPFGAGNGTRLAVAARTEGTTGGLDMCFTGESDKRLGHDETLIARTSE
jgi:hypothetical protein